MDVHKLKLFVALATTQHFGRAAESCHVSPSTLSRNLKQLEDDLHAKLVDRDSRSVALTPAGEDFLVFAREVLQQWETFQDSVAASAHELKGQISIYCSVTASYSFLYDILADFRLAHPGIALKLHTGDPAQAIARVTSGSEDVAIAAKPDQLPSGLVFKTITRSPLMFIAPREQAYWSAAVSTARPGWQKIPMITSEEGIARERLDGWFGRNGIKPNIYAEVKGHEAIVSMVSLGFGVGVVPKIVVDNSPLADRVVAFTEQPDLGPYDVGVCVLERRLKSPIISALWGQIGEGRQ
jgi:LysR family positive regulator for ilvC